MSWFSSYLQGQDVGSYYNLLSTFFLPLLCTGTFPLLFFIFFHFAIASEALYKVFRKAELNRLEIKGIFIG
jgi:hypothetical protein